MGYWAVFDWLTLALVAGSLVYVLLRPPPAALRPSLCVALLLAFVRMVGDLGTTRDLEHPHLWLGLLHGSGLIQTAAAWIVGVRFAEAYGLPFAWARSRWVYAPVGISLVLAGVAATNPWHGAYLEPVPGSRSLYGPLASVAAVYAYSFNLAMVVLYATLRRRHRSWLVRRKASLLILAYAAGPIFNVGYALAPSPPPFDLSVLGIFWSTSLVMLGIYRTGLFNPLPVALPEVISSDPNPVVLLDPNGYPYFANAAARELFPRSTWTADAPFPVHLARLLWRPHSGGPVGPDELRRELDPAEAGPIGRLYLLEGSPPRFLRVQSTPIRAAGDVELGSCVRLQDESALQHAEASVRSSEARFRTLADRANDLIAEMDERGNCLYLNPRHVALFGSLAECPSAFSFLHPDDVPRAQERLAKLVETGESAEETLRCIDRNDQVRWLEVRAAAFRTPSGELRVVSVGRDVTERQRAEEARRLASLGTLAGGLARDLNELLVPILGSTSFLLEELSQDGVAEEKLVEIEGAAGRAADLVARLLAYVGEAPLERQRVDLGGLLRGLRPVLEHDPARRGTLHVDLASGLPRVNADPERLRQVILALVRNAWEALADRGGTVTLSCAQRVVASDDLSDPDTEAELRRAGNYLALAVEDDGSGIEPALRGAIFDPFVSSRGPRRGLGLAIALGIVRAHGGAIRAQSRPGGGSRFEVLLPEA